MQIAIQQQWVKKIDRNLYEIRTSYNGIYLRGCYFQVKEQKYFITHGFKKRRMKHRKGKKKEVVRLEKSILNLKGKRSSDVKSKR